VLCNFCNVVEFAVKNKIYMIQSAKISVCLTPEIRLEHALIQADIKDPATVCQLIVTGLITKSDFRYIRERMSKTLQELDISGASVEGNIIDDFALKICTGLTSVIIPDSVTKIGESAFYRCADLNVVTIPKSVQKIDESAI